MSEKFSYSILTYRYSLFLGEVLNVGVLMIFPDENLVEFHYPKKISRLKGLYNNFNESLIKDYLKAFEQKSKNLNNQLEKYVFGYNDLIADNFIVEDASALQFEDFRTAIYYSDFEITRERYIDLILSNYNSEINGTTHILTEDKIVRRLKSKIIEINPNAKEFLKLDKNRILTNKHVEFKSDFYWENVITNYTKAINFDLSSEKNILDKSILFNGQLRQLEKSTLKNIKIDFVINEPKDKKFGDAIEEAKTILKEIQIDKSLYTNLKTYSEYVASQIAI
ncbi:DUF3037 domain-containing protein [Brumimicrobium glaciale]|uniref:DUF3037 domain-containing protein n=1 Tax=Brumimicrobium glaciale TaxID=200475 RepID=A0A4Q4KDX3_9FLAO|nr:DUF3037 domain-containing protein [Brumimicrobium glaciale]RYM30838.1 DUF3037 domain-containing protein [Brumimicrobium glaciale]